MTISQLARSIPESATLKLNEEARFLRQKGEPVIHLGGGEPKNKAPITALLASAAKLNTAEVKYVPTDGLPSLKKAIIRYTEEYYGRLVAPENLVVSTGAKQALYNALLTIVDPQDEVVIIAPHWVSYPEMVKLAYGIPVVVTPEDGTFVPRMEEIKLAVGSYTKAIIINSPNNPSGVIYPPELIAELVEFCETKGIYLIMDDIYHKLVFDGNYAAPAYKFTKKDVDESHIIVINGVSKLYGMTGFRIGWSIAPRPMTEAMANIQAQTTSCASVISQAAAEGALTGMQSLVENLRMTIENQRNVMLNELRTISNLPLNPPQGTFYCLPDFRAYSNNSIELAEFLLKKALVVTVPGQPFGMEGHIRLSYCGPIKDIKEGVQRIRWALDPTAPNEIYIGDRRLVRDWL